MNTRQSYRIEHFIFVVCLIIVTAFIGQLPAFGKSAPASAEQLRRDLETALKAKDTNAVISLFDWDGVPEEAKEMTIGMEVEDVLGADVASVALTPLSTKLEAMMSNEQNGWQGDNGRRVKYSVAVLGQLDVCLSNLNKVPLPYGRKASSFFLAAPIPYLAHGKPLNVRVLRYPPSLTYTGSWVYVSEGRETRVEISGRTNQFRQGWGDYVKSCIIRRTSTNTLSARGSSFYYEISEGGKIIFKSSAMTNEDPVVYERNQPVEPPASAKQIQKEIDAALKKEDADWRKHRDRELPVDVSYRMGDDCILVFQNYSRDSLPLTVTAKDEVSNDWRENVHPARTNTCQFVLAGKSTKDVDLLAGWRITTDDRIRVEIVNPKYDNSYIYVIHDHTTSHKIAAQQEAIFNEYNRTNDEAARDRDAHLLSNLWHDGLLEDGIKYQLVQDHYQLVLNQTNIPDVGPTLEVKSSQSFPFPNVRTEFIPTRFLNNEVKWFSNERTNFLHGFGPINGVNVVKETASGPTEGGYIQYMSMADGSMHGWYRSEYKNGDEVQYGIDLIQNDGGRLWRTNLLSNKIVIQGMKK